MKRLFLAAVIAAAVAFVAAAPVTAQDVQNGSFKVAAAGSCQSWFSSCAARCKSRVPDDKNCVSDHCSPKLAACRSNGCWQEGNAYGAGRHCGLAK